MARTCRFHLFRNRGLGRVFVFSRALERMAGARQGVPRVKAGLGRNNPPVGSIDAGRNELQQPAWHESGFAGSISLRVFPVSAGSSAVVYSMGRPVRNPGEAVVVQDSANHIRGMSLDVPDDSPENSGTALAGEWSSISDIRKPRRLTTAFSSDFHGVPNLAREHPKTLSPVRRTACSFRIGPGD